MKSIILFLISIFIFSGCAKVSQEVNDAVDATTGLGVAKIKIEKVDPTLAKSKCIALCQSAIVAETDLSKGPCLGDPIPGMNDWVCDVAHNPREEVDDDLNNQCLTFRTGSSKHFVEVDENCGFIKSD